MSPLPSILKFQKNTCRCNWLCKTQKARSPATHSAELASLRGMRYVLIGVFSILAPALCAAQFYVGTIGGIATLSADAGSRSSDQALSLSSYSPSNGGALNVFVGAHLHDYFSVQANYIWNQNDLVLNSASSNSSTFYQQARSSSQHAVVFDFLLYFRKRNSRIRPYLGTGGGVTHLASREERLIAFGGTPALPSASFSSTSPVFRSHVGMDIGIFRKVDFRYSFSELIGKNGISKHLSPPAPRRLANFQNLFGFVMCF
jgi:Outer membrane protein beta-barrel domain